MFDQFVIIENIEIFQFMITLLNLGFQLYLIGFVWRGS